MYYVYLISSVDFPEETYIGDTTNIDQRLGEHNSGKSIYTQRYKPWKIVSYFAFSCKDKALDFERYLKSGAGRAFANKHLK